MIKNFACKETQKIWNREFSSKFPLEIQSLARRKLLMLDAAERVDDLRIPPGNRLEKLAGKKNKVRYSIRINNQWRVRFGFEDGGAFAVEIVDYH